MKMMLFYTVVVTAVEVEKKNIITVNTFSLRAYDGISKGPKPPDPGFMNFAISIKCFITINSIYPPLPVLDVGIKPL